MSASACWLKVLRRTGGVALIAAGMFSLVLPLVPGWLLIALGFYLLLMDVPVMRKRFVVALSARTPRLRRFIERMLPVEKNEPRGSGDNGG